jgi:hypothetical protein
MLEKISTESTFNIFAHEAEEKLHTQHNVKPSSETRNFFVICEKQQSFET